MSDADDPAAAEPEASAPDAALEVAPAPVEAEEYRGPTMPVSSLGDKLKGFGVILVTLVAVGFTLNYSFSPSSPLLNAEGPKVNEGMVKYGAVVTSVGAGE